MLLCFRERGGLRPRVEAETDMEGEAVRRGFFTSSREAVILFEIISIFEPPFPAIFYLFAEADC